MPAACARRRGLSLLEMLAVCGLLAILAAVLMARGGEAALAARKNQCDAQQRNIEVQAQLWFRQRGTWPAADLSDIAADTNYFPEGIPRCPVDSRTYTFDVRSGRVAGHGH